MFIIKRNFKRENVDMGKLTIRIEKMTHGLSSMVVPAELAQKVVDGLYDGATTTEIDSLTAETAVSLSTKHPDYALLASRIAITNLHKKTMESFSETMKLLFEFKEAKTGKHVPLIADDVYDIVKANAELLDRTIVHARDFDFDYFGFKTLEKSYLLRMDDKVAERPQHLYMRVAIGIHKNDIESVINTYHLMSEHLV